MKIVAINGGPRKTWNTATLLAEALRGAEDAGAQTELVHLYDLDFKGCISCFACKLKGGSSYGKCAVQDGLQPVLQKIEEADALLIGSPVYLGNVTGETRSFLERLLFQYMVYDAEMSSLFPKKMPVGLIYTLGAPEERMKQMGFDKNLQSVTLFIQSIFGSAESLTVNDTYQFDDYSKYESSRFDAAAKARRREEVFPLDCRKAYELGARLAGGR